ncbi:unnamed protein product [Caenorhabditis nigoni]
MAVSAMQFTLFTVLDPKYWPSLIILCLSAVCSAIFVILSSCDVVNFCRVKYGPIYVLAHVAFALTVAFHFPAKEPRYVFMYTFACCLIDWLFAKNWLLVDLTMGGQKKPRKPHASIFENYI